MAKKRSQAARKNQPVEEKNHVAFVFSASALIAVAEFVNSNMDKINDEFGGVAFKLSKDDFLFKLQDVSCIAETKDNFLAIELKPDANQKHCSSLFLFNKRDIKHIYIDFDQKITYKHEIAENDKKQNATYVG